VELVQQLQGKLGLIVTLSIRRDNCELTFKVVRELIKPPSLNDWIGTLADPQYARAIKRLQPSACKKI